MDYFKFINRAVEDMELRLKEKLTQDNISEKVFMSPFHFQRIFRAMTGYSVMEYVRKRRLSEAAREITGTDKPILEIAFDYNFNSQEAFTRAFLKEFGITPGKLRKEKCGVKLFEKMRLWGLRYRKKYENIKMDWEINRFNGITACGIMREITLNEDKNYEEVIEICKELEEYSGEIENRKTDEVHREYGVVFSGDIDLKNPYNNTFNYFRGVEVDKRGGHSGKLMYKEIPPVTCAVFQASIDVEKHREVLDYVYGVWLPESGYKIAGGFDFMEIMTIDGDGRYDMKFYIPVVVEGQDSTKYQNEKSGL